MSAFIRELIRTEIESRGDEEKVFSKDKLKQLKNK
jgi:hypothetical protein